MGIDHELRRGLITSTDVGPIFEVDSYGRTGFDRWAEKKGHAPRWDPTPRMLMGKDVEQGIMKAYERLTGRKVAWTDRTLQHPQRTWMGASPDALVFAPSDALDRVVDAKLVFWDQRRKWGATSHQIPEGIQLQMWWIMAVLECEVCDVAAWAGEDEPRIYQIERDREAERVMIAKCEEWHRRYIEGDEIPPISGSKGAAVWLQQTFPRQRADIREATADEVEALESLALARRDLKEADERRKVLENEIKLAIGDHEGLEWEWGKFTWKLTKDKKKIDWKALGTHLLITRIKDEEERKTLESEYTKTEPGTRRVHFVSALHDIAEIE